MENFKLKFNLSWEYIQEYNDAIWLGSSCGGAFRLNNAFLYCPEMVSVQSIIKSEFKRQNWFLEYSHRVVFLRKSSKSTLFPIRSTHKVLCLLRVSKLLKLNTNCNWLLNRETDFYPSSALTRQINWISLWWMHLNYDNKCMYAELKTWM